MKGEEDLTSIRASFLDSSSLAVSLHVFSRIVFFFTSWTFHKQYSFCDFSRSSKLLTRFLYVVSILSLKKKLGLSMKGILQQDSENLTSTPLGLFSYFQESIRESQNYGVLLPHAVIFPSALELSKPTNNMNQYRELGLRCYSTIRLEMKKKL